MLDYKILCSSTFTYTIFVCSQVNKHNFGTRVCHKTTAKKQDKCDDRLQQMFYLPERFL